MQAEEIVRLRSAAHRSRRIVSMMVLGLLLAAGGWLAVGAQLAGEESGTTKIMTSAVNVLMIAVAAVVMLAGVVVLIEDDRALKKLGANPPDEVVGLKAAFWIDSALAGLFTLLAATFVVVRLAA